METEKLKQIIENHHLWLKGEGGSRADLSGAYLSGAYLYRANLSGANLSGAYLYRANLSGADLSGADLSGAYLYRANLYRANLSGANLSEANLSGWQIPQEGELVVWKKGNGKLIKLRIPPESKRTACLINRKCRAEFAEVLEIEDGKPITTRKNCTYEIGQKVIPDSYDDDPRQDCTHGIHFFLTKEEAERW